MKQDIDNITKVVSATLYPSKSALRKALNRGESIFIEDLANSSLSGRLGSRVKTPIIVTSNDRTWFALITRDNQNKFVVK